MNLLVVGLGTKFDDGRRQGGNGDAGVARVFWPLYTGPCGSAQGVLPPKVCHEARVPSHLLPPRSR